MAGALTDKLRKASGSTRPVVTSLALPKANGATTAELTSGSGWNTTTGVDVVMYRRQLNSTTGLYEKVDGTQTEWIGALTGTTLSLPALPNAGTEPASGYAADGNTVVYCAPTSQWADDVIDTLLTLFNQDQTLKPGPIQTALGLGASALNGWNALGFTPATVTYNGNRSYDLVFNGQDLTTTLSAGMRLRTTRTVAAPTQSTSLNGTSQYYSKTSPAGMTFTDDFAAGAWVKLNSYADGGVISRWNGTSGWILRVTSSGQLRIIGTNAGAGNAKTVESYQSLPLNKWVHITAQLDMSTFTATATTNYIMIDGVDVPVSLSSVGTNPTSLVQAGNLEVGTYNATNFFPGKIAQAFVASAKITQANVRTLISQGLTASLISTHSIVSAYSFNNSITDLNTTNANDLTANGAATATEADSPFGTQADGTISSSLDYMIVQQSSFDVGLNATVFTVQVSEGCTVPTSGGVASLVYSSNKAPYGFPLDKTKWRVEALLRSRIDIGIPLTTNYYPSNFGLTIPQGKWKVGYDVMFSGTGTSASTISSFFALHTANAIIPEGSIDMDWVAWNYSQPAVTVVLANLNRENNVDYATPTSLYAVGKVNVAAGSFGYSIRAETRTSVIYADNQYV